MLRTLLLAPLAGALVFASPAIGQLDNHPDSFQRHAEDPGAGDEEDAQQRAIPSERGRDAYWLDDDRDAGRDEGGQFESYEFELDRPDDRVEGGDARDSSQRERPVARQRPDDGQDMVRQDRDRYTYPLEPNRNATEEGEGDEGADAPPTYRSEPSRLDREGALPRRDHSSAEAIWHVRAALNVAALACRDANEVRTVAAYNGMLSARQATLADADARTKALYRARFGGRWQHMHDMAMTKLYNFFARPPERDDFCRVAQQVLDEVQTVPDAAFAAFANDALARLEAPFSTSNRQADGYRTSRESREGATS